MKNLGSLRREILRGAQNDKNSLLMAHWYETSAQSYLVILSGANDPVVSRTYEILRSRGSLIMTGGDFPGGLNWGIDTSGGGGRGGFRTRRGALKQAQKPGRDKN